MTKTLSPATWRLPRLKRAPILCVALLVTLAGALAHAETLNSILSRLDATSKSNHSFSANMQWEEYTRAIKNTDHYTGTIKLKRKGDGVIGRMDVEKPSVYTWHFAGDIWEKYTPASNVVQTVKISKLAKSADQYLLLVFGASGAYLQKNFELKVVGEEKLAGLDATHLELIPKDPKGREQVAKVDAWIPLGQTYALQVKATEPNGDYNTWTYLEARVNPGLPDTAFQFKVPPGAQRQ